MRSGRVKKVKGDLEQFAADKKNLKSDDAVGLALNKAKTERLSEFKEQVERDLEYAN